MSELRQECLWEFVSKPTVAAQALAGEHKADVCVIGGGITGLTLANILERVGINYVVLEAYSDIAPQVGASIGFFANGTRVLDQIDIYEPMVNLYRTLLNTTDIMLEGKKIATFRGAASHGIRR